MPMHGSFRCTLSGITSGARVAESPRGLGWLGQLHLETGRKYIHIGKIEPGSRAASMGNLSPGLLLVAVDGTPVGGQPFDIVVGQCEIPHALCRRPRPPSHPFWLAPCTSAAAPDKKHHSEALPQGGALSDLQRAVRPPPRRMAKRPLKLAFRPSDTEQSAPPAMVPMISRAPAAAFLGDEPSQQVPRSPSRCLPHSS